MTDDEHDDTTNEEELREFTRDLFRTTPKPDNDENPTPTRTFLRRLFTN